MMEVPGGRDTKVVARVVIPVVVDVELAVVEVDVHAVAVRIEILPIFIRNHRKA